MRERLVIYEPDEGAWHLAVELLANPEVAIAAIVVPDDVAEPAESVPMFARLRRALLSCVTRDAASAAADSEITAVIDASSPPRFRERHPDVEARGIAVLPPFAARLLWTAEDAAGAGPARAARRIRELAETVPPFADRTSVCDGLLALAIRVAGAQFGSLLLREPGSDTLGVSASTHLDRELWPSIRIESGDGIAGRVAASGRALRLVGRERRDAPATAPPRFDVAASLTIPLRTGDRLMGVLCLHHRWDEKAFDKEAIRHARRIAPALARILATTETPAAPVPGERPDPWRTLAAQQLHLGAAEDLADVVRRATEAAAATLRADHAILRLRDPSSGRFAIRAYAGDAEGSLRTELFLRDRHVAAQAVAEKHPVSPPDGTAIALPLRREGRLVGTLAVYRRTASDAAANEPFDGSDSERLAHLGEAIEQAMQAAVDRDRATRGHPLDPETDLAGAAAIAETIHAEIIRANRTGDTLALVVCSIANYDAIAAQHDGARLAQRTAAALRAHVREFDVLARTAPAEFLALLPHPGPHAADRILALTRAVADDLTKDDALNVPVRVALRFGYAVHPEDGRDRDTLLRHARRLQIQVV